MRLIPKKILLAIMENKSLSHQKNLISFYGIQRSGNHAVINWLCGMIYSPLFINNLMPKKNISRYHSPISLPEGVRFLSKRDGNHIIYPEKNELTYNGGAKKNGAIIVSYENLIISSKMIADQKQFFQNRVGFYKEKIDIILIRNPLDMMASQIDLITRYQNKTDLYKKSVKSMIKNLIMKRELYIRPREALIVNALRHYCDLWSLYSKCFLENQQFDNKTVYIFFEKWLSDKRYRENIAASLGLEYNERNKDFVSDSGGGSSFVENASSKDLNYSSLTSRYEKSPHKELIYKILKEHPDAFHNWTKIYSSQS